MSVGRRRAAPRWLAASAVVVAALAAPSAGPALGQPSPAIAAELRAHGTGDATMRARVEESAADGGYRLVVRREAGCPRPVVHEEAIPDAPLGLFQLWDEDGLPLSTWAAGSVYRVRAHLLAPGGVRAVLEAASRGAPGFALDRRSRAAVTTTERTGGPRGGLRGSPGPGTGHAPSATGGHRRRRPDAGRGGPVHDDPAASRPPWSAARGGRALRRRHPGFEGASPVGAAPMPPPSPRAGSPAARSRAA